MIWISSCKLKATSSQLDRMSWHIHFVLGCLESTGHTTETLRHLAIVNELKLLYLSIFENLRKCAAELGCSLQKNYIHKSNLSIHSEHNKAHTWKTWAFFTHSGKSRPFPISIPITCRIPRLMICKHTPCWQCQGSNPDSTFWNDVPSTRTTDSILRDFGHFTYGRLCRTILHVSVADHTGVLCSFSYLWLGWLSWIDMRYDQLQTFSCHILRNRVVARVALSNCLQ